MGITFPGESPEYRAARGRLLGQEIELRRATEAVAAARRESPAGGVVPQDYVFQGASADGSPADVRLSELFAPGKDSLVIYSMMFPRDPGDQRPGPADSETARLPLAEGPCPSCTAPLDQLEGRRGPRNPARQPGGRREGPAAAHPHLRQGARLAAATPAVLGRRHLYNRDYFAETADGSQMPMLNVFHRDGEAIRHFWGSELRLRGVPKGY